ncbi:DUF6252 family protein [Photobacterium satsumensis]|uniref:DUF6252 family protein n=1 Tax=Photobacterium satsumensis TaxID=2910239 RepID=UPI003D1104E2
MKSCASFLASFILIPAVITLTSCNSDNDNDDGGIFIPVEPFMSADIDDEAWDAEIIIFTAPSGHLIVNGLGDDGTAIKLVIDNYTGVGSYNFNPSDLDTFASRQDTDNNFFTYLGGSGELVVTSDEEGEFGRQVSGTFNFTANNAIQGAITITVSNGEFAADLLDNQ